MTIDKKYVEVIANEIKQKINKLPQVAIILGSGLSCIADEMTNKVVIKYSQLTNMLNSTVEGHKNQFIVGDLSGKTVIVMQGRFHPYDGFTAKQSVLPIYIFKLLGVKTLIVTTSCGGVNESYNAGDLMLIKSHINLTGMNPLVGGAIIDYGKQFIDLTNAYNKRYIAIIKDIAKDNNISINEGVFAQNLGPTYETPAEGEMLRKIGVDAVSMSTALEVIAARQCEIEVLGISSITNKVAGYDDRVLNHQEVLINAGKMAQNLKILIKEFLKQI